MKECISKNENPTLNGLYTWYQEQSHVYIILLKFTFSYMHALNLFLTSVRRGNFKVMLACQNKFSQLFYGLNMTIYMDINYRMDKLVQSAPPEVINFISKSLCLSQSGHESKAEGCDFILENVNKKIKESARHGNYESMY